MSQLAPTFDSPAGFELTEEVGRGGMGVVFRARDMVFDRDVALKVLLGDPASSAAKRFTDEAKITARLQHPGIPAVHQTGTLPDGRPFLVMKLIQGRTLSALLKERGHGSVKWLGVFESICQAVGAAHAAGYIHRDLKPSNVMVGAFGEVQVMDWGLARRVRNAERGVRNEIKAEFVSGSAILQSAIGNPQSDDTLPAAEDSSAADRTNPYAPAADTDEGDSTKAGTVMGTPAYMAPEQARGEVDRVDRRADVFALGAILCELLTSKPPLSGKAVQVIADAAGGKFDEAFSRLDGCGEDRELIALCKRCLSVNPDARPADASEVATAVANYRGAADARVKRAEVERGQAETRVAETRKRQRVIVWAAGIAVGILLAGVVGVALGLFEAKKQEGIARGETALKELARADEQSAKDEAIVAKGKAEAAAEAEKAAKKRAVEFRNNALDALRAATSTDVEKLIGEKKILGANERAYLEAIASRWQQFARQDGTDVDVRSVQAEGHLRVAFLWNKLGRREEAKKEYQVAIELLKKLAEQFPDVLEHHQNLAVAHMHLGTQLKGLGKLNEARVEFGLACDLGKGLVERFPDAPTPQQNLAAVHTNLGFLLAGSGQAEEARKEYDQAIHMQKRLVDRFPDVPACQEGLATAHNNLGMLLAGLNRREEAQAEFVKARDLQKRLADQFPDVPAYQQSLATAHNNLGSLLAMYGRREEAKAEFGHARDLRKELVTQYPSVPLYQMELANTHNNTGLLFAQQGRMEQAGVEYGHARDLLKGLAQQFPTDSDYLLGLAKSHHGMGLLLAGLGKRVEAMGEYELAIVLQKRLIDRLPAVPAYRVELGMSYCNVGLLVRADGRPADCLDWFQKAIDTLRPVYDKEPRDVTAKKFLSDSYRSRADAHGQLNKHAEAVTDWDHAIKLGTKGEQFLWRASRATSVLHAGQVAEAVAEVAELRKNVAFWPAIQNYDFACIYAVASDKLADKKGEYADAAMEMLQKAVKAGYKDVAHIKVDTELDPLRGREDFKKLLTDLEAKYPLPKEVLPPPRADK